MVCGPPDRDKKSERMTRDTGTHVPPQLATCFYISFNIWREMRNPINAVSTNFSLDITKSDIQKEGGDMKERKEKVKQVLVLKISIDFLFYMINVAKSREEENWFEV